MSECWRCRNVMKCVIRLAWLKRAGKGVNRDDYGQSSSMALTDSPYNILGIILNEDW